MRISKSLIISLFSLLLTLPVWAASPSVEVKKEALKHAIAEQANLLGSVNNQLCFIAPTLSADSVEVFETVLLYNPATGESKTWGKLNDGIRDFGYTTYKNSLILAGGFHDSVSVSEVLVLSGTAAMEIKSLNPLPQAVVKPVLGVVGDWLIVTSGTVDGNANVNTWKLNLRNSDAQWQQVATLPVSGVPFNYGIVQNAGAEDIFYLFGTHAMAYSLKADTWTIGSADTETPQNLNVTPITVGTHHILFMDNNGGYSAFHTVTSRWDNKNFSAEAGNSQLVKGCDGHVAYNAGALNKLTFVNKTNFGFLNYSVLVVYLVAMLLIGFYFSRKATSSDQFFTGGGSIPWWAAGISIFATTLSAITFMAIPAKAYTTNWLYFPMSFSIILVAPIVIRWYLPFFRGLNLTSAYEYLEKRFNLSVRMVSSALFIIFMVTRIGIVLYLPSVALSTVTGIDLLTCIIAMSIVTIIYSTMGGVEAVVWGDVVQGGILVFGALISVVYLVVETGGIAETISIAASADKFRVLDLSFDLTQPTFWVIFLGAGMANSLITYTSDQTIVQRYLTTSDMEKTKRSIWLNGIIALPVLVVFYFIGSALYSFFFVHPELLPQTMSNAEGIFPYFIVNELPAGLAGLLIAAIFAATMSTLSSNINSASTAITVDFAKRLSPNMSDKTILNTARISGIVVGVLGTWLAIELSMMEIKSFFDEFNTFIGLLTSGLGGLFAIGIFLPRVRGYAAMIALVSSVLILLWMKSHSPLNFMLYGLIGIVLSMAIGYILSFILPEKKKDLSGLVWAQRSALEKAEGQSVKEKVTE
ncbi:MAG: sodium:solute symporter family transporter [Marinifilaceae bacterium]